MAKELIVTASAALGGTPIRATFHDTDFVKPTIYDVSTTSGVQQRMKVWAPTGSHNNQKVQVSDHTNLSQHWKTFLASVVRDAGTPNIRSSLLTYTLHSSQVLSQTLQPGARFEIGLVEPISGTVDASSFTAKGAAPAAYSVEFGIGEAGDRDGFVDVYNYGVLVHSFEQVGALDTSTVIKIEITPFLWKVWVGGTIVYSNSHSSGTIFPLNLRYRYRHINGLSNAEPSGGYIFNEPVLSGAWKPAADIFWGDLFYGGDTIIGFLGYSATDTLLDVPGFAATNYGIDAVGAPFVEFLMPAAGNYTPFGGGAAQALAYIKTAVSWNKVGFLGGTSDYQTPGWAESVAIESVSGGAGQPLTVDGANPITLTPTYNGADFVAVPHRVTASYPASELTYTAVGGYGSFGTGADKNLYTPPTDAGVYTFKVTRGSEEVTVTVKVPCVLAPAAVSMVGSADQIFETNFDVQDYATTGWDVTGGTLADEAIRSVTYTAPSSMGSYEVRAEAAVSGILTGQIAAIVTVATAGTPPSTGLRLTPASISSAVNTFVTVTMEGDADTPVWATLTSCRIDGSNNNLFILNNRAASEAIIAQAIRAGTANLKWAFNSTNLATAVDSPFYSWMVVDDAEGVVARLTLQYLLSGNDWRVSVVVLGEEVATEDFTATSTTEIQIDFTSSVAAAFKYRASSGDGWTTLTTQTSLVGSRYFKFRFQPSINSQASNTVIVAKPTLSGDFGRWYPPTFNADLVDALGSVIGSLPVSRQLSSVVIGTQQYWVAVVTLNAAGLGRVRASYPSGIVPQNTVPITIGTASTPLVVTSPSSPLTIDPGGTQTVTTNYDVTDASYFAPPGNGSFGRTVPTVNIYTAPAKSGLYYFEVRKGSETVRIDVRVKAKITPTSISVVAGQTVQLSVNYDGTDQSVTASGGNATFGAKSGGNTVINYTAPGSAGSHTITYSNPINNVSVDVTVTAVGVDPIAISNTDPSTVQPGATLQVLTNYPASEVTFTVKLYGTSINLSGYFASDMFTAPLAAGKYEITAAKSGVGSDTLIVIVPIKITPKTPAPVRYPNQIQFGANYSPVTFSVPPSRAGTITATGVFSPGTTPDTITVTVTGVIDGVTYTDTANVNVLAPFLSLQNPATMTVQPAATVTVLPALPYVVGDVTFAATGGSFASNVWTAPADAGTYTITVTHTASGQTATIVVTVPVVLAPLTWAMQVNDTKGFTINADIISWAPSAGLNLTSIATRSVTASATVAGTYTLQGNTALGSLTATITVTGTAAVPIVITNQDPTVVEPGGTLEIKTNYAYPDAITPITFSYSPIVTGGGFTGNVFRAPTQAGSYTITATRGASSDTMAVHVPVRISPAAVVLQPGQKQQFTVNHPSPTWSSAQSGGFLDAFGMYEAGFTPGAYPNGIRVSVSITPPPANTATASVTIQSIDLIVYGPRSITLEPGGTHRVESNPSGRAVSYTAGGGSFGAGIDANLYTAPPVAGNYYFLVTYAGQTVRVDVHVPLRISPKEVNLAAGQSIQFTVNAAGAGWGVYSPYGNTGTITPSGLYTAPTSGGTVVTVTASANGDSDTATVYFLAIYPYNPTYSVEWESVARVVLVRTEDGNPKGRLKSTSKRAYQLRYGAREKAEVVEARAFHATRFPDVPFLFHDHNLGEYVPVFFDSAIKVQVDGACNFNYSFRIVEV